MKKIFSLFVALTAVFSLSAKTLYFAPNANWQKDNAQFAVYTIDDEKWIDMVAVEGEDVIYKADVSAEITKVIFCRMNPAREENRWNKEVEPDPSKKPVWNQTKDLELQAEKDLYTYPEGAWDKADGVWSKYGEEPEPQPTKYYLKNNWKGEKEWSWKEMTAREDGKYELLKVVFGGTGVNLNVAETDDGSKFFSSEEKAEGLKIQGNKIQALDTVNFVLELKTEEAIVTAELVGRPKAPEYRLENGYYLFGSPFDWKLENVKAAQKFVANGDKGEWVLKEVKLEVGDSIKVIEVAADTIKAWFGTEGGDKNYGIDEKHAGEKKDIYFNPTKQDKWNGYIWIGETIFLKDLKLVPGVWTADDARLVVWAFGDEVEDAFSVFSGDGDTLVAKINEKADSVIFVRMDPKKGIEWAAEWDRTKNLLIEDCGIFFVNYWDQYSWCEAKEPVIPANFYVTGDSAFLKDAGSEKGVWDPKAIESKNDTLVLNLKGGQIYRFKVLPEGDWEKPNKGFGELSDKKGLLPDSSYNVSFGLNKDGEVKIVYIPAKEDKAEIFKVIGDLALENLKLVPGVASADRAKFAAWIWEIDQPGAWTEFFAGAGDTLSVEIPAFADSIIFARFNPIVETPYWPSNPEDQNMWNNTDHKLIDHKGLTFTATSIFDGTWERYIPEPPAKYYIVGDSAIVGSKEKEWQPDGLKAMSDTTVLNLQPGKFSMRLTLEGTWEGPQRDFRHLTDTAKGLVEYIDDYSNHNITFELKEAGEVKVIFIAASEAGQPEVFKLIGNFFVPEPGPQPELPYVALIGEMNNWDGSAANQLKPAEDNKTASAKFELALNDNKGYNFKILVGSLGLSAHGVDGKYVIHREWTSAKLDWAAENSEPLWLSIDVAGEYTFTFNFEDSVLTVGFPEKPEPLADGYYLVGTFNDWTASAEVKLALNEAVAAQGVEEYAINIELAEGDSLKVVKIAGEESTWFPKDKNVGIDADHAGKKDVYFRPAGKDEWKEFDESGFFWIDANEPSAVDNTEVSVKAVKTLRNGMLIIEKNGVRYTVTGQAIR